MSPENYSYQIYGGSFLTEPPVLDRSVNLLLFRDPEEKEYQIIITRGFLKEEQTVEEWCKQEIESLRNKLPGFAEEGKKLEHEIGPAKLPVIQLANCFLRDGKKARQVQSIVRLPKHDLYNPRNNELLIFSLTTDEEFTEFQRKHYVTVINSFVPAV